MPINLLGEPKHPIKKIETPEEVAMHIPAKELKKIEKTKKKTAKIEAKKKAAIVKKEALAEVNLIKAFKKYVWKRRLTFSALLVIIILMAGSVFAYFTFFYKPQPKIVQNINKPITVNLPIVNLPPTPLAYCGDNLCNNNETCSLCPDDCGSCPLPPSPPETPPIIPPPIMPPPPPPVTTPPPLPDTELATLRGALVRFGGDSNIYLIELNGELRKVDMQSVYFKDGEKISEIKLILIYTISDRFKNVRKGKGVIGYVDWDPRILSPEELAFFQ